MSEPRFVARVPEGQNCSPAPALGFVSATDGDAMCVTCATTHQKWKLPKTSVHLHVGEVAKGAQRYMGRICKPSEIMARRSS